MRGSKFHKTVRMANRLARRISYLQPSLQESEMRPSIRHGYLNVSCFNLRLEYHHTAGHCYILENPVNSLLFNLPAIRVSRPSKRGFFFVRLLEMCVLVA